MDKKYIIFTKGNSYNYSNWLQDWFSGTGKDQGCYLEGTWLDMIYFARNILASENTKLVAPEYYHPEWKNDNYCVKDIYVFEEK